MHCPRQIAIATTDFESPLSSHTEVAEVASLSADGRTVNLRDSRVCHEYSNSGLPQTCKHSPVGALTYTHVGEVKTIDGRDVPFRAEVGLLSRNIVIEGDYDARLCPLADLADDGVTRLSCNQFGAQIFLSSPGHESLTGRLANLEIRNGGQAFRLGRYAIHWHMIGNVKQSFQRNCSIHHSWNRGVAVHGVHFLRVESNFAYHSMGHTFFTEDGIEAYNRLENNFALKTIPSMNLLNTDQTPAGFWIVSGRNYVIGNHAVASRRYGLWFRPERSLTGTSVNTPMDAHPINIPVLEFRDNVAHSNGKYGLRVFDIFLPNEPSVFRDTFVWRNGKAGFTATVVGQVGFDGMIAVQNGKVVFEGRTTQVSSWDVNYIRNALIVDYIDLPLHESYGVFEDSFSDVAALGGPAHDGILLPWNVDAGGGMSIENVTFVNFLNPCIRGCAHCGRGGSPSVGDGAAETRFSGMRFVNSSERVLFRHPHEAYLRDLDGTLTGTDVVEDYTRGGTTRGVAFVGTSVLHPSGACVESSYSTHGSGGSVCTGHIFKKFWHYVKDPDTWVGKSLCVRRPDQHKNDINRCDTLKKECNCVPWLKMSDKGHVFLMAEGVRYNVFHDLQQHELADLNKYDVKVWDVSPGENYLVSHYFLEWEVADKYHRAMYWSQPGSARQLYPANYRYNASDCPFKEQPTACGTLKPISDWADLDDDKMSMYEEDHEEGTEPDATEGKVAIPASTNACWDYTFTQDQDFYGGTHTMLIKGSNQHRKATITIKPCPAKGCPPPPPAPPPPPPDDFFSLWSAPSTWANLTSHLANPLNKLEEVSLGRRKYAYTVKEAQLWNASIPSANDNVWIPSWKKVLLDVKTPVLSKLVIEGVLLVNSTDVAMLEAVYVEVKGGKLIIADTDSQGNVVGPFRGNATVILHGTNDRISALHGADPRNTPSYLVGRQGHVIDGGMIAVSGELIARGQPSGTAWASLASTAAKGATSLVVDSAVTWPRGAEVVVTATDFAVHEAEVGPTAPRSPSASRARARS